MAYKLIERPYRNVFTKNPIRYAFSVTNPDTAGSAMEVELYVVPHNFYLLNLNLLLGTTLMLKQSKLLCRQTLTPNPDGTVYFYCEDFLHSFLNWELPPLGSNDPMPVTKQSCKFWIRYRQVTKNNPSPPYVADLSSLCLAIKGGVAKEKFDYNNFFVNYMATKPFLTWQPSGHLIGLNERRYLTFFYETYIPPVGATVQLYQKARVVYSDGSNDVVTKALPSLRTACLVHLPAGLQQLGLFNLQPDKQVWYYDVSVEDATGNVYASPYRLYADYNNYYKVFSFTYHNSLGGIDTLRIRGDWDKTNNREYIEIQQAITSYGGEILPLENGATNVSVYKVYKGDAGYFNTRKMQEACEELLYSESIFQEHQGRWMRVVNIAKTQEMGSKSDTIWSFPLQWRYTYDNTQFTPEDINLGTGAPVQLNGQLYGSCTAPSNLAVAFVDQNVNGRKYRFTWNEVDGAEGYELEYKTDDTDWVMVPAVANQVDITFGVSDDYIWRLRTKCSESDFSGYVSGPGFTVQNAAAVCQAPASLNLILINYNDTKATVKFTWPAVAGVVGYQLEWREVGTAVWSQVATTAAETSKQVELKKDAQYERRVRSACNNSGDWSAYVYGDPFIPSNLLGSCSAPTGLAAVVMNTFLFDMRAVKITWDAVATVIEYELTFRHNSPAGTWVTLSTNQTEHYAHYAKGQPWEMKVRSKCSDGSWSAFSPIKTFNT